MTYFPDTNHLDRSDTGAIINGGSIGVNEVLSYFRATASMPNRKEWNIYLINMYTILRNVYDKNKSPAKLLEAIDRDIGLISTYIEAYKDYMPNTGKYVVLFYVPNYDAIPDTIRRSVTEQIKAMNAFYKTQVQRKYEKSITNISGNGAYLIAPVGTRSRYPHTELAYFINTECTKYIDRIKYPVIFSHCPIDLHLGKALTTLDLIESYTADVKPRIEFGFKLTKEVRMPFLPITHRLFGDSVHIQPLVQRNLKTKMLELAQDNNWYLRTSYDIEKDVLANSEIKKEDLEIKGIS